MKKNRQFLFTKEKLTNKWTDDSPVVTNTDFENYEGKLLNYCLLQALLIIKQDKSNKPVQPLRMPF